MQRYLLIHHTFRDIHIGNLVFATVSTLDHIIKPESASSKTDNGRGFVLRAMTKVSCYNLFITYLKSSFIIILIKNKKNKIDDLCHKIRATSFLLTSQIPWRAYVACG